ncbi:hypothetical protein BGZ60DRAFT_418841 [Tricladium varicosporioides]|nr:hypothetical protein BGZ60DRAFT_418841 [Hymenoscyphus varicosporioides]
MNISLYFSSLVTQFLFTTIYIAETALRLLGFSIHHNIENSPKNHTFLSFLGTTSNPPPNNMLYKQTSILALAALFISASAAPTPVDTRSEAAADVCFNFGGKQVCTIDKRAEAAADVCFTFGGKQVCTIDKRAEAAADLCFTFAGKRVCTIDKRAVAEERSEEGATHLSPPSTPEHV